jgi:predicted membrane protein
MKKLDVKKMTVAAMLIAVGVVLPSFTGGIPQVGKMLLPMHLPVMIAGFALGGPWGALVGAVTPLLRSSFFMFPVMYPNAVAMAFELAAYGLITGLLYRSWKGPKVLRIYGPLLCAMLGGRLVWGLMQTILVGLLGSGFSLAAFWAGAFATALPGVVLQLVIVPLVIYALEKAGYLKK